MGGSCGRPLRRWQELGSRVGWVLVQDDVSLETRGWTH